MGLKEIVAVCHTDSLSEEDKRELTYEAVIDMFRVLRVFGVDVDQVFHTLGTMWTGPSTFVEAFADFVVDPLDKQAIDEKAHINVRAYKGRQSLVTVFLTHGKYSAEVRGTVEDVNAIMDDVAQSIKELRNLDTE
jgi:hypothetical protein